MNNYHWTLLQGRRWLSMSKRPLKTTAPNEVYKAELRKFIEEIEDNRSLAMIYGFTKVHYEHCKEKR